MKTFINGIDKINDLVGRASAWCLFCIICIIAIEVFSRYILERPTIWAWDTNSQLFSLVTFLSGGYTYLKGKHVSIDIFYSKWTEKKKALADIITFPVFLMFALPLIYTLGSLAHESFVNRETVSSAWAPPIYPIKIIAVIGACLLTLQGLAIFIRNVCTLIKK